MESSGQESLAFELINFQSDFYQNSTIGSESAISNFLQKEPIGGKSKPNSPYASLILKIY